MKIQPSIGELKSAQEGGKAQERASGTPAAAAAQGGSDRVDLSPLSAQIAALESSLAAEPGFDAARVESIKQAIVEGRLSVDAQTVADRMIASALAMLGRRDA